MATTAADVLSGEVSPDGQTRLLVAAASGVLLICALIYTGMVAKYVVMVVFLAVDVCIV